jgi:hypothetical protein
MPIFVGTTQVVGSSGTNTMPLPTTTAGGSLLFNDGTNMYWAYPGDTQSTIGSGWRYRTLYTHGYIAAGYKGSNPWRSLNKCWHMTDTTIYVGEQLDYSGSYLDGCFSDLNAYVYGTFNGIGVNTGSSIHTSSYSLFNGTSRSQNDLNFNFFGSATVPYGYTGQDPGNPQGQDGTAGGSGIAYGTGWNTTTNTQPSGVGGWEMSVARSNHGCATAVINQAGYIFGGGSAVTSKHHLPTEIMYTTTTSPQTWGATAAIGGQNFAYIQGLSTTAGQQYMNFANDSFTQWSSFTGAGLSSDGVNKNLMSKWGIFWCGRDTNTSTNQALCNDTNQTYTSTVQKTSNHGEENYHMGQDWGYMLGSYNGQQNNWAVKYNYSTQAMSTLGFAAQPKGHAGTSSGASSTAAMSVTSQVRD